MSIRNVCIIAHVDHGKTTLVDFLLKQAGTFRDNQEVAERVMDSMDLERERGITILAKNTSVRYNDTKINIIDTPGHADFGGEVERIMGMAQGAILLVDAAEGPLPQTRFVLQKAIQQGLKIILVINKVDRPEVREGTRIDEVINHTFDLFCDLGASDEQTDFTTVYACGREGWCTLNRDEVPAILAKEKTADLRPIFDLILEQVRAPEVEDGPFRMQITNLSYNEFLGQMGVGRVVSGELRKNEKIWIKSYEADDTIVEKSFNATGVFSFEGLAQVEVPVLKAGDIGLVAGFEAVQIGDSFVAQQGQPPLPKLKIDAPTLGMIFSINTSPLSGQEGEAVQSRKLRDRLLRACRYNVALRFQETESADRFRILGRGELQFGILIEQMRREGLEFMVGRPQVLFKKEADGSMTEPIERAVLDFPESFSGEVAELFQLRKGIMTHYQNLEGNRIRMEFEIPTRGILGIQSRYLTATRGEGLFSSEVKEYVAHKGPLLHRSTGCLIADRAGEAIEYALLSLEDRGILFIEPGLKLYEGMIIGECNKENDLNVNASKEKKLTNMRAAGSDAFTRLAGIRKMSLERCIEWIDDDEWIEVTPQNIRLRKKILPANQRSVKRGD